MSNQKEIKELREQLHRLLLILTGAGGPENEGLVKLRRELSIKIGEDDPADAKVEDKKS